MDFHDTGAWAENQVANLLNEHLMELHRLESEYLVTELVQAIQDDERDFCSKCREELRITTILQGDEPVEATVCLYCDFPDLQPTARIDSNRVLTQMHRNPYEDMAHESMCCSSCNGTGWGGGGPDFGNCGVCKGAGGWEPGAAFWREYDVYCYLTRDIEYELRTVQRGKSFSQSLVWDVNLKQYVWKRDEESL